MLDEAASRARPPRGGDGDPFAGFGTPAAYLLDADGRVEEPMAYGRGRGARRAPPNWRDRAAGPEDARPTACAHGGGTTGSTKCSTSRLQRRVRPRGREGDGASRPSGPAPPPTGSATSTSGSGYNDPATAAVVDRLLPGARVQDRRAPDNFSIALYPGGAGGSRRLNLLVRDGRQLVRSRSRPGPWPPS